MRSVKTVPCRTQEWDFCYNPYSVPIITYCSSHLVLEIDSKFLYLQDRSIPVGYKNFSKVMKKLPAGPVGI